jgi:hypothetical protein
MNMIMIFIVIMIMIMNSISISIQFQFHFNFNYGQTSIRVEHNRISASFRLKLHKDKLQLINKDPRMMVLVVKLHPGKAFPVSAAVGAIRKIYITRNSAPYRALFSSSCGGLVALVAPTLPLLPQPCPCCPYHAPVAP